MDNKEEKKIQAWNTFTASGKVEDYLKYNSIDKVDGYGNDKNKGDSSCGDNPWRTR